MDYVIYMGGICCVAQWNRGSGIDLFVWFYINQIILVIETSRTKHQNQFQFISNFKLSINFIILNNVTHYQQPTISLFLSWAFLIFNSILLWMFVKLWTMHYSQKPK